MITTENGIFYNYNFSTSVCTSFKIKTKSPLSTNIKILKKIIWEIYLVSCVCFYIYVRIYYFFTLPEKYSLYRFSNIRIYFLYVTINIFSGQRWPAVLKYVSGYKKVDDKTLQIKITSYKKYLGKPILIIFWHIVQKSIEIIKYLFSMEKKKSYYIGRN